MKLKNNFSHDLCPVGLQSRVCDRKVDRYAGGNICVSSISELLCRAHWRSFRVRTVQDVIRMIPAVFDRLTHWCTGGIP